MAYVYSTLATDVNYAFYVPGGADVPVKEKHIHVKGGAGVANDRLITPRGVVTEITDDEAVLLESHPVFKIHKDNGFVVIDKKKVDVEKVVSNMTGRDNSAPMTDNDFKDVNPTAKGKQDKDE